ncbi:MAG: hypothetical protein ACRC6M_17505 [Microcystaceae cyanobacterium]
MKLFLNFGKTSMTIAINKLSFADYCSHTDRSDRRYELVDGELIPMSLGTVQHGEIATDKSSSFKVKIMARLIHRKNLAC